LSVDIDLTYVPIDERETAITSIHSTLENIAGDIERLIPNAAVIPRRVGKNIIGVSVRADKCNVKIEPNSVLRGTILRTGYDDCYATGSGNVRIDF